MFPNNLKIFWIAIFSLRSPLIHLYKSYLIRLFNNVFKSYNKSLILTSILHR